jgi:hypothetical protein
MTTLGTGETSVTGIGMITIRNVTTGAVVKSSVVRVTIKARIITILGGIRTNITKTDRAEHHCELVCVSENPITWYRTRKHRDINVIPF